MPHQHMEEVTWFDVQQWAPEAYSAAMDKGLDHLQVFLFEPMDDQPTTMIDGEPWVLHAESPVQEEQDPDEAYEWDPSTGEWADMLYHS